MAEDILELNALAPERTKVPLKWPSDQYDEDGVMVPNELEVELAVREDFGATQQRELYRMRAEYEEIIGADKPTKAQLNRADMILFRLARMLIIGGPDDAVRALPDVTLWDVANRFFIRADVKTVNLMGVPEIQGMSRLASSLRDSNGSTEETPNDG